MVLRPEGRRVGLGWWASRQGISGLKWPCSLPHSAMPMLSIVCHKCAIFLDIRLASFCGINTLIKISIHSLFLARHGKPKVHWTTEKFLFNYFMWKLKLKLPPFALCSELYPGYNCSPSHILCRSIKTCPRCPVLSTSEKSCHFAKKY